MFYTVDGTLLEEHGITGLEVSSFKHKFGYGGNDNSIRSIRLRNRLRTPTTSDNELWCNYFQHSSQYVEDYSILYPINQHPIQGSKLQQPRHIPMPHLDLKMELIVVMKIMENPYPMRHHTDQPPS